MRAAKVITNAVGAIVAILMLASCGGSFTDVVNSANSAAASAAIAPSDQSAEQSAGESSDAGGGASAGAAETVPGFTDGVLDEQSATISWGQSDAPVTVEIWVDLLCPPCQSYHAEAAPVLHETVGAGDVLLVIHPVAILDTQSNPAGYSSRAAAALFCAAEEPAGYPYLQALLEMQPPEGGPGLSDDELLAVGTDLGLSSDWAACVSDETYADLAKQGADLLVAAGYTGTPTVVVNGEVLTDPSRQGLASAINAAK